RFNVQRMIYGGQVDEHDYHKSGYTFDILEAFLKIHKFSRITKVQEFGLFQDTTTMKYLGVRISLNVEAVK
ncbi:MAG TPA: hypothetical protein VG797_01785, partial [Phycisphaerales bacterium]|nr:hypothetical protein [Phycisphaerales bacterium]